MAAATDKFRLSAPLWSTTLNGAISSSSTTIVLQSVTSLPTGTGVTLVIDAKDGSGNLTPTKQETITGVVSTGTSSIINCVRGVEGTAQSHATGATINAYVTAADWNSLVNGLLTSLNQDGTLIGSAVRTALGQTGQTGAGWTTLAYTPNTVTANGNRSYTCVYNGVDLTGTLSPGMRLMHQRTVAAPTQVTALNGTNQYWSKTSPAGMTFTNMFVASAWVKLSAYGTAMGVISRYNGTSGWLFWVDTDGTVRLQGVNGGAGNFNRVHSYQSLPLNKWVHVSAQLDMSTSTLDATHSWIMIDGVNVPAAKETLGTNPTALIQAGNLEVGSWNAGTNPWNGKIAQVAVYSAAVSQATILASMHQGLAGTETSLISAYSFNGNGNDLNANANNLTANGGAAATTADSPFGGQAGGTISSTLDYGIITSASFSTNTTLVVQVPEGCTIPTSGGVSAVSYSSTAIPYGLPAISKWKLSAYDTSGTLTVPLLNIMVQYVINNPLDNLAFQNAGTAAGVFYLSQNGNTKQISGQSANALVASTAGPSFTITFPVGFFSSINTANVNVQQLATVAQQSINGGLLPSVTGWTVTIWAAATTTVEQFGFNVLGS